VIGRPIGSSAIGDSAGRAFEVSKRGPAIGDGSQSREEISL
jgi:hypothetical protein